ncbi:MAG: hypothetical protein WCG03_07570, partial [Kiritimatiellales bacterium]
TVRKYSVTEHACPAEGMGGADVVIKTEDHAKLGMITEWTAEDSRPYLKKKKNATRASLCGRISGRDAAATLSRRRIDST